MVEVISCAVKKNNKADFLLDEKKTFLRLEENGYSHLIYDFLV